MERGGVRVWGDGVTVCCCTMKLERRGNTGTVCGRDRRQKS